MRYYDITITNPRTGEIVRPDALRSLNLPTTFASHINGRRIAGALNIEFNIPLYNYEAFLGGALIQIWGLPIKEVSQVTDLAGHDIIIRAGMQRGLPLANPAQSGVIIQGRIWQAFGNWAGTDMNIGLQINPETGQGGTPPPLNFHFFWPANTPLTDAIRATLRTAMPDFAVQIGISNELKQAHDEGAPYSDLPAFAAMISSLTKASVFRGIQTLSGLPYDGVHITVRKKTVVVSDGTVNMDGGTVSNPKVIAFQDLIGQPTWFSPLQVSFRTVLRADISVGDVVKLPDRLQSPFVITLPGSVPPGNPKPVRSTFQGNFIVRSMIHYGNFRQPTADAWCTVFQAVFGATNPVVSASGSAAP